MANQIEIDYKKLNQIVEAGSLYVHTPAESSAAYVQYVEELYAAPTINWGCQAMDNRRVTPMRPGEMTVVLGRPGNAKTSFLIYMARKEARRCNIEKGECVVFITWEEPIESIEMSIQSGANYTSENIAFGEVSLDVVRQASTGRATLPLVLFGKSLVKDRGTRKPPMYISKVRDAIMALYYEFGLKPVLICADYLQKIPVERAKNRIDEVTEAVYLLSELAVDVNSSILVAAQASREVDDQGLPIPMLSGGQWTSAIEQEAFRMLGQLRPITIKKKDGKALDEIKIRGEDYKVDKNLMILMLLKQRKYFPPTSIYPVHFKPDTFELYDIDSLTQQPYTVGTNGVQIPGR